MYLQKVNACAARTVTRAQQKLSDLDIKLNRLHSQKAALQYKLKHQENSQRKARTRTLIQTNVTLDPLMASPPSSLYARSVSDVETASARENARAARTEQIPESISSDDLETFKNKGVNFLKKNAM